MEGRFKRGYRFYSFEIGANGAPLIIFCCTLRETDLQCPFRICFPLTQRVGIRSAGGLSPAKCRPRLSLTWIGEGIGAMFFCRKCKNISCAYFRNRNYSYHIVLFAYCPFPCKHLRCRAGHVNVAVF